MAARVALATTDRETCLPASRHTTDPATNSTSTAPQEPLPRVSCRPFPLCHLTLARKASRPTGSNCPIFNVTYKVLSHTNYAVVFARHFTIHCVFPKRTNSLFFSIYPQGVFMGGTSHVISSMICMSILQKM